MKQLPLRGRKQKKPRKLLSFFGLSFFLLLAPFQGLNAQKEGIDPCGTDEYLKERLEKKGISEGEYERELLQLRKKAKASSSTRSGHIDTIPVVVHVIHDGGDANISFDQIKDGIRVMNEDFRRTNNDTTETRPVFDSLAADTEIRFRLARKDPNGNCTNGVTRTRSKLTHEADNRLKSLVRWPTDRYLNFWLADDLGSSGSGTLLGYAQFPWGGIDNTYGIVQRHDRFGSIGTSGSDGRTATHEVGHCLGLAHTFQGNGCGGDCSSTGDGICDTPPTDENTFGCDKGQNTCSNDTQGPSPYTSDVPDQIENYMSYDACQNMFSEGQKNLMKGVLTNIEGLETLVSDSNMKFTGVREDPLCKADFEADKRIVCKDDSVSFNDLSYHKIDKRSWIFHGGAPFFAVGQKNPRIAYEKPGLYNVELTVDQGNSSLNAEKKELIRVIDDIGDPTPFNEDMESDPVKKARILPLMGYDGMKWRMSDRFGASGDRSMIFENYLAEDGKEYDFETASIDASNDTSVALEFKVAYRKRTSNDNDRIEVFASKGCEKGWSQRGSFSATQMASGSPTNNYYEPSASDWKTFRIETPLNFGYNVEGLRFKFRFITDGGNNIYVDDINVSRPDALSVEKDSEKDPQLSLYPNPATDRVQLKLSGNEKARNYSLRDGTGRVLREGSVEKGTELDVSGMSAGVYFVEVQGEGQRTVKKLVLR